MTTTTVEPMIGLTLNYGEGKHDRTPLHYRKGHRAVTRSRKRTDERRWRREEGV
jgi:hypothetical protein